jgi:hypothetical protein
VRNKFSRVASMYAHYDDSREIFMIHADAAFIFLLQHILLVLQW